MKQETTTAQAVAWVVYTHGGEAGEGWRIVADQADLPAEVAEQVGMTPWMNIPEYSTGEPGDYWATRVYPGTGPNRSRRSRVEQEAQVLNRTIQAALRRHAEKQEAAEAGFHAGYNETPYAEPLAGWDNELRQIWYSTFRSGTSKRQNERNEAAAARSLERIDRVLNPAAAARRDEDRRRHQANERIRLAEGRPAYKPTAKPGDRIRLP